MNPVDALLEQTLWDHFWLPPWATRVARDELIYTHSERPLNFLNMVVKVRGTGPGLEAAVDEVSEAHASVSSRWLLSPFSHSEELEGLLTARGFCEEFQHTAYATDPRAWESGPDRGLAVRAVSEESDLLDLIGVTAQAFDAPIPAVPADRIADELAAVRGPRPRVHRFVAYDTRSGAPLSGGGLNWFPDLNVGFLWGGGTVPEGRGRGAYRAVVDARLRRAAELGCTLVGVYARNETSAPILGALGFGAHGPLVSWKRDLAQEA